MKLAQKRQTFQATEYIEYRLTTCLENLEMSGNSEHVREMSGMLLTVRELSRKCQGISECLESGHQSRSSIAPV